MHNIIEFIRSYRQFRNTPIVDDDFPKIRNKTDVMGTNLEHLVTKFKDVKVVCLCGSTKFKDEFIAMNKKLTLQGNIVLSVGHFDHSDKEPCTAEQKIQLDELHKRKIDLADFVFILNVDGYIGESTRSEIEYATQQRKTICYLT